MNKRLDKIYEDMDSLENERIDCLNRLEAVQEQQLDEFMINYLWKSKEMCYML